jgi:hypothetical protein
VHVQVLSDARAGRLAEVDPDVDPLRRDRLLEPRHCAAYEPKQPVVLALRERLELGLVPVRDDQKVPGGERIAVQDDEPVVGRDEDVRLAEARRVGGGVLAEDAPPLLFREDVLHPPGSPELVGHGRKSSREFPAEEELCCLSA